MNGGFFAFMVIVAQRLEHWFVEPKVAGSNPVGHPKIMKYDKIGQKLNTSLKGGVPMNIVLEIMRSLDRLANNPFFPTERKVETMLEKYGFLTFMVFVCPKMRPKYLKFKDQELYMPVEAAENSLVFPRLPKLQSLVSKLWTIGVPSKLIFMIGDNGYDTYKGPPSGVILDQKILNERRELYTKDLEVKLLRKFPQLLEVESLGLMGIGLYKGNIEIPSEMLAREVAFQRFTFDKYYSGNIPSNEILKEIATLKIIAYAEQGFLIEAADAILISTEGTNLDSWVQRTQMFQVGGAKFSSIYPYIRQKTLGN